jgi:hypothetical protein
MTSQLAGRAIEEVQNDVVVLNLPALFDLVVVARFTAATVGARADFDIDEIEDLRLAVDELCISFGSLEDHESIEMRFERSMNTVKITCSFEGTRPDADRTDIAGMDWQRTDSLSLQLLDALVDEHGRDEHGDHPCAWVLKRGAATTG